MKGGEEMNNGLLPKSFWTMPNLRMPTLWEDLLDETRLASIPSGLSVSEDEKNFYVDAALPGIDPKDIEVTFDRGQLDITAQSKVEEKGKKYYRRATSQFAYTVTAPEGINSKKEPKVTYRNGMMHAIFEKVPASKPKRIEVKAE